MPVTLTNEFEQEPIRTLEVGGHQITPRYSSYFQASADKVKELIATGEFDAAAIELCPSRHKAIVNPDVTKWISSRLSIKAISMVTASYLRCFQQRMATTGIEPGLKCTAIKDAAEAASHFTHR